MSKCNKVRVDAEVICRTQAFLEKINQKKMKNNIINVEKKHNVPLILILRSRKSLDTTPRREFQPSISCGLTLRAFCQFVPYIHKAVQFKPFV